MFQIFAQPFSALAVGWLIYWAVTTRWSIHQQKGLDR